MNELNIIKKGVKMNIINNEILDIEILKVLLPSPTTSVYKIIDQLKEKKVNVKRINYPTTRRRITQLEKNGYIKIEKGQNLRKDGQVDKRGGINILLTFKGLFKLIIDADLTDSEVRLTIDKSRANIFKTKTRITEITVVKEMPVKALRQSFEQMRSRINLNHFDENYAIELFLKMQ